MKIKLCSLSFFLGVLCSLNVFASDVLYIYKKDSTVVGYPIDYVKAIHTDAEEHIVYVGENSYSCPVSEIDRVSFDSPLLPQFITFHFNDKYNLQLPSNIDCLYDTTENCWRGSVNSIGHYLVPSFQLKSGVKVYFNETRVKSKKSVLNFKERVELLLVDSTVQLLSKQGEDSYQFLPCTNKVSVDVHFPSDTANVNKVYIWTEGGVDVQSKTDYLSAKMEISDNGVFSGYSDSTYIKGRGNTTWSSTYKKPYRLKLYSKGKPLGLDRGKSWNLLNNYRDSSMMCNAMAMKIGHMLGIPFTNHMLPVDLYLNGEYRGNYSFTEKIGIANNSVDSEEELGAYILEFDTYLFEDPYSNKYQEEYKDSSSIFHLPFCVSEPDLDEMQEENARYFFSKTKLDLKELEEAIAEKDSDDIMNYIDVELLAKTFFVYDVTFNNEVNWPKSVYFYKLDTLGSLFSMGPLWDFDLAFGQYSQMYDFQPAMDWRLLGTPIWPNDVGYSYRGSGYMFFYYIRQNRAFQKAYYEVYKEFARRLPELYDFAESYYLYGKSSFEKNAELWQCGKDAEALLSRFKEWITYRVETLYRHMREYDSSLPENPDI
ncbi:MAG: CotH kinase family protein [Paludibacteraceae bacterium]|jgi:hypothetical protein|nr:CotH kinase family protein [Paludibacteraceae bacterium]